MHDDPRYRIEYPQRAQRQPVIFEQQEAPRRQRHFFWWLLLVPLLFVAVSWLAQPWRQTIGWIEVMEYLRVPQGSREEYTQLAMLGVLICAALAGYRTITK